MTKPYATLTAEQIASFRRDGFLAIEAITSARELARLGGVYDRLFAEGAGREEGNQFDLAGADQEGVRASLPQILSPSKYAPELKESQYWANALAIGRQLLGPEAQIDFDHAILKPAGHGAPTPWHQDEAYWDPGLVYESLSVWMPLQEASRENGCMQFVPGSHRLEVVPHHPIGHDPRVHGLEVDEADTSTAVACPLPAGGATMHHCRTLHYASGNRSAGDRRAYILVVAVPTRKRETPRVFPWLTQRHSGRAQQAKEGAGG